MHHPSIQTRSVVADFSKMISIQEYVDLVANNFSDMDIGVVCVNAGVASFGPFALVDNQSI